MSSSANLTTHDPPSPSLEGQATQLLVIFFFHLGFHAKCIDRVIIMLLHALFGIVTVNDLDLKSDEVTNIFYSIF